MSNQVYDHVVPDYDMYDAEGQVIVQGVVNIPDRDYFLRDGAGWFEYNGVTIRVWSDEKADCLEVAAFRTGREHEIPLCEYCVPYKEEMPW